MDRQTLDRLRGEPLARSIAHATDFSPASEGAFRHALALALAIEGPVQLALLHATGNHDAPADWSRYPEVRTALEDWKRLPPDSPPADVLAQLDLAVRKVALSEGDPLALLDDFLASDPPDLLVLGTGGRTGLPRWLSPSFAERLARSARTMTLFVPRDARGFVDERSGEVRLRRVLVPVDHAPRPQLAVDQAVRCGGLVRNLALEITVLHVGAEADAPAVDLPDCFDYSWYREARSGAVAKAILDASVDRQADLVIMPTAGHHGVLDALRGSVTECVVRDAPCPVLAIPATEA